MNKFKSYTLGLFFSILGKLALALSSGTEMPADITTNTKLVEAGITWGILIGGIVVIAAVIYMWYSGHLTGKMASTFGGLAIVLGGALYGIQWWTEKAGSATAGFFF